MSENTFIVGTPKPVDVDALAHRESELRAQLGTLGKETTLEEVGEKTREWFGVVAQLLNAHALGQSAISQGLALTLGDIVGHLSVGKVHCAINYAAAGAGRRPEVPLERADKQAAVDYIALVKAGGSTPTGKVTSKDPVNDIAKAYEVSRRTVQNWVATYPVAEGITDVPHKFILDRAKAGARRYRSAGRSSNAISTRDAKRK